jgi:hypothetical protein
MTSRKPVCPTVPTPGDGTVGHQPIARDNARDTSGTLSLKALARKGFLRDKAWDIAGTAASNACPSSSVAVGQEPEPRAASCDIEFDERAAIVEYDGGAPREWAEGFARLDPARPLPGFTLAHWLQLIDDGGRFLDRWAHTAVELGWSAEDVFGLNPAAPAVRQDSKGLVALIGGGEVVDIRVDRATIKMQSGNCLTYYLRRPTAGAVVVWKLAREPGYAASGAGASSAASTAAEASSAER